MTGCHGLTAHALPIVLNAVIAPWKRPSTMRLFGNRAKAQMPMNGYLYARDVGMNTRLNRIPFTDRIRTNSNAFGHLLAQCPVCSSKSECALLRNAGTVQSPPLADRLMASAHPIPVCRVELMLLKTRGDGLHVGTNTQADAWR